MRRLVGWGNNVAQNIIPQPAVPFIDRPKEITPSSGCERLIWHTWECSMGRDSAGKIVPWGSAPRIDPGAQFERPLGHDQPIGYLQNGRAVLFDGETSQNAYNDIALTGLGDAYAVTDGAVLHFATIEDLMNGEPDTRHTHPLLKDAQLYAMDSRCFVRAQSHLFEVDKSGLRLIEDVEGLGIRRVIPGRRNRLGVITDAGEAYVIDTKAKEAEVLELGPEDEDVEIKHLGLGSDFEVVVTADKVMTRGSSERHPAPRDSRRAHPDQTRQIWPTRTRRHRS